MTQYYFKLHAEGRVYGPFTSSELRGLARSGRLRQTDLISSGKTRKKWVPASEVRNLPFQDADRSAETDFTDVDVELASTSPPPGQGLELTQSEASTVDAQKKHRHFLLAHPQAVSAVDIARAPFTTWTLTESGWNCLIILGWTLAIMAMNLLMGPEGLEAGFALAFTLAASVLAAGHLLKRYLTICRTAVLDDPDHEFSFWQCVRLALQLAIVGPLPMAASVALLVGSVGDGLGWMVLSTGLCLATAAWMAIVYPMILIHLAVNRRIHVSRALHWVRRSLPDVLVIYGSLVVVTGLMAGVLLLVMLLAGTTILASGIAALGLAAVVHVAAQYVSTAYYVMLSLAVRKNGLAGSVSQSFVDASVNSSFTPRSQGTPLSCGA